MKKGWKILIIIVCTLGLAVCAISAYRAIITYEITSVINQFKVDPSWQLAGGRITPPGLCIEGGCPSAAREWKTGTFVDRETLQGLLDRNKWHDVKIEDSKCFSSINDTNRNIPCSARGHADNYNVSIYVSQNDPVLNEPTLSLYIN